MRKVNTKCPVNRYYPRYILTLRSRLQTHRLAQGREYSRGVLGMAIIPAYIFIYFCTGFHQESVPFFHWIFGPCLIFMHAGLRYVFALVTDWPPPAKVSTSSALQPWVKPQS
ncbi:hypothetical protein B0T25DRAFT_292980 [Lasiosphaeria hispida]|uniref:Uncharacterized protein n=1 Tax=Lasiosphaeria hispida TaxID=260671 RepID=A0AAJ0HCD7_9PEZI|nr:hypothetical protein B0T25DRAFT_292980 [Lasiosphaeria hispida]